MSEQNKQLARRFIDGFVSGDTAVLKEIIIEDFVDHNPLPGQQPGRQGVLDSLAGWRAAFPDMEITVHREVAEGDWVVQYGMVSGTNTGSLMGMPATGRRAVFPYMDMHRTENGQIVETWHLEDVAGMLRQLGLMPS